MLAPWFPDGSYSPTFLQHILDFCTRWKPAADVLALVATPVAGLWLLYTYRRSVNLEKAKWMRELYEKFYEHPDLKKTRDILDGGNFNQISKLVRDEQPEFTDYLNFFEFLAYLRDSGQIEISEVRGLFDYYLGILRNNAEVAQYVAEPANGFEKLSRLLEQDPVELLFVYGTLLDGLRKEFRTSVEAEDLGDAEINRAKLYDLGQYPGAIRSTSIDDRVRGKLYKLRNPQSAMRNLDHYEDFFPLSDKDSLFFRQAVPVYARGHAQGTAWVYFYNKPVSEASRIETGDYRKRSEIITSPPPKPPASES